MSMSELRAATAADAPACAELLQDWLEATAWMPKLHSRAETGIWMATTLFPQSEVQLAEAGEICGFLALQGQGEIAQLIVAPSMRGQGLGRALLDWAKARSHGTLGLWCFEANAAALRFYAREGFSIETRTDGESEEGLPDLYLRWRAS